MKRRKIRSESGQAIIEYILILVVVVGILLGVAYQFNSAFRNYVMNFFGNYIACLLETGEMPGLGAQTGSAVCDAFFQPFNMANGSPGPAGSGGGGGPGASGGSGGGANTVGRGRGRGGGSNSNSSGGGPGADGSGYGSRPATAASLVNRRGRPPQMAAGEIAPEASEGPESLELSKGRSRPVATVNPETGRVTRMSMDRRFFAARELEQGEKGKPIVSKVSPDGDGDGSLRPKVTTYEAKRGVAKATEDENEDFSLGAILRWLLIIAIVVTLVLLIGGQALQIVKSGEK